MKFKIKYCSECECEYVECPRCKNNCCNGSYGEIDGKECDICELSYEYQDLYFKRLKNDRC